MVRSPPTTRRSSPAAGRGRRTAACSTTIAELGVPALRAREGGIEQEQRAENVTFRVTGQSRAQLFPLDLVPRIIDAHEWAALCDGLVQRARALDAFLRDVYSDQQIVARRHLGVHAIDRAPGFRSTGRLAADRVRAHVSGTDLVCDRAGHWMVLEDNLRVPSGHRVRGRQPPAARQVPARTAATGPSGRHRPGTADAAATRCARRPRRTRVTTSKSRCCQWVGRTPPGSSTPSWPRRWACHWCSHRICRFATGELVRHVGTGRAPRRRPLRPDGRGHAAVVHRLRRRAAAARSARRDRRRHVDDRQRAGQRRRRRQGRCTPTCRR